MMGVDGQLWFLTAECTQDELDHRSEWELFCDSTEPRKKCDSPTALSFNALSYGHSAL